MERFQMLGQGVIGCVLLLASPALYGHWQAEEKPLRLGIGGKAHDPSLHPPAFRCGISRTLGAAAG